MGYSNAKFDVELTLEQLIDLLIKNEKISLETEHGQIQMGFVHFYNVLPDYNHEDEGGLKYNFQALVIDETSQDRNAKVELATIDKQTFTGSVEWEHYQDNMCEGG